ncbi:MAG: hypothetical protein HOP13_04285 [Alphaproteobacteria bacterium]|nr:hypothetical protein [Alphaproteobacteria bacterium]
MKPSHPRPRLFLAPPDYFADDLGVRLEQTSRFSLALLGALAIHVLALVGLALSISFQPPKPQLVEARIVAVAVAPAPPPPPDVEALAPVDAPVLIPRFRPREPRGLNPEQQSRHGDPALAVWKYLCNRDLSLGDTVRRDCPAFDFGGLDMNVRDPLNRRGDAGVMLGNGTATMSLEEAGVARGWIRPPPPKGQSSLAGTTDQVNKPGGHELYEDLPQLEHPMEGAPDPN